MPTLGKRKANVVTIRGEGGERGKREEIRQRREGRGGREKEGRKKGERTIPPRPWPRARHLSLLTTVNKELANFRGDVTAVSDGKPGAGWGEGRSVGTCEAKRGRVRPGEAKR